MQPDRLAASSDMAMVSAKEYPPISQAKMHPANMAGSALRAKKKGRTSGVNKLPIRGESKIIPTIGIHIGPIV